METDYNFRSYKDILEDKLEDLKRYVEVLYKENQELREIINNKYKQELTTSHKGVNSCPSIARQLNEDRIIQEMYDEPDDPFTGF